MASMRRGGLGLDGTCGWWRPMDGSLPAAFFHAWLGRMGGALDKSGLQAGGGGGGTGEQGVSGCEPARARQRNRAKGHARQRTAVVLVLEPHQPRHQRTGQSGSAGAHTRCQRPLPAVSPWHATHSARADLAPAHISAPPATAQAGDGAYCVLATAANTAVANTETVGAAGGQEQPRHAVTRAA